MVVPFRRIEEEEQVWGRGWGHRKKTNSGFDTETWDIYKQSSKDAQQTNGSIDLEIQRDT